MTFTLRISNIVYETPFDCVDVNYAAAHWLIMTTRNETGKT